MEEAITYDFDDAPQVEGSLGLNDEAGDASRDRNLNDLLFSPKKKKSKKKSSNSSVTSKETNKVKKKKKKKTSLDGSHVEENGEDDDGSVISSRSTKSSKSTRSTRSTRKKRIKKKSDDNGDGDGDDVSVSSKKSRKGKKKKSGIEDNEVSAHSRKIKRAGKKKQTTSLDDFLDTRDAIQSPTSRTSKGDDNDVGDDRIHLAAENEALNAEVVALRQKLSDALSSDSPEVIQMRTEIQRYEHENHELAAEVGEFEDALTEKDNLIKKLTEAVDQQLDKVESLEIKLQRAEEEFCKMEDELKFMEDELVALKTNDNSSHIVQEEEMFDDGIEDESPVNSHAALSNDPDFINGTGRQLMDDKLKQLTKREQELDQRESDVYRREQSLLDREQAVAGQEQELLNKAEEDLSAEMDSIRIKELKIQERERELNDLEERLNLQASRQNEAEIEGFRKNADDESESPAMFSDESSMNSEVVNGVGDDNSLVNDETSDESRTLQAKVQELENKIEEMQELMERKSNEDDDKSDILNELRSKVKDSQVELVELQDENLQLRQAESDLISRIKELESEHYTEIQNIQEGNNRQIQELYEETRALQTETTVLREENERLKLSIPEEDVDHTDRALTRLQDEIAGLREKIVAKEMEVKIRSDKILESATQLEEKGQEIEELKVEMELVRSQVNDTKEATSKKMTQKDETIAFMQDQMVRIMKEKSESDTKLRAKEQELKKKVPASPVKLITNVEKHQEADQAKEQAFKDQIGRLEHANEKLIADIDQLRYQHTMELKEKEAKVLEYEEELADLNWEIKTRKEADYVSLLKDRKERKKELEQTKKELTKSTEQVEELQRDVENLKRQIEDLEKDMAEVNKSLLARDSGDYVSGLKRQIRSLKDHNIALERKLELEVASAKKTLAKKNATIFSLRREISTMNQPGQAVMRIFNRGSNIEERLLTESTHSALRRSSHHSPTKEVKKENDLSQRLDRAITTLPNRASLWNAIRSPFAQSKKSAKTIGEEKAGLSIEAPQVTKEETLQHSEEPAASLQNIDENGIDDDDDRCNRDNKDDVGQSPIVVAGDTHGTELGSSEDEDDDLMESDDDAEEEDVDSEHKPTNRKPEKAFV